MREAARKNFRLLEEGQEGDVTERGLRWFKLPQKKIPLAPGIQMHVTGPPGFLNSTYIA